MWGPSRISQLFLSPHFYFTIQMSTLFKSTVNMLWAVIIAGVIKLGGRYNEINHRSDLYDLVYTET